MKTNSLDWSLLDNGGIRWGAVIAAVLLWSLVVNSMSQSFVLAFLPFITFWLIYAVGVTYTRLLGNNWQNTHPQALTKLSGFLVVSALLLIVLPFIGLVATMLVSALAVKASLEGSPGKRASEGKYIDQNANRVSLEAKRQLAQHDSQDTGILFGDVRIPTQSFTKNTLMLGTVGSGKSVSMKLIAKEALKGIGSSIDKRVLIYDPASEWPAILDAMGIPDSAVIITNPFDQRCRPWWISRDIVTPADAMALAEILVPIPPGTNDPFWIKTTQICIAAVVRYFNETAPEQWTLRDLVMALRSRDLIVRMCEDDPKLQHYTQVHGTENTATNIMASIITSIEKYEAIAALWHAAETVYGNQPFSIEEWLESSSVLLLGRSNKAEQALKEINRIMFKRVTQCIMDGRKKSKPSTWMFIDEMGSLGKLDTLITAATELRKYGGALVAGFQSISHIVDNFNENIANTILSQFNHIACLRLSDPKSEKWIRDLSGRVRYTRTLTSMTRGGDGKPSVTTSYQHGEEDTLRAGSLSEIPIFEPKLGVGLGGYYFWADKRWQNTYQPAIVEQLPPQGKPELEFIPMPGKYQSPKPWVETDWKRLGITHLVSEAQNALTPSDDFVIQQLDDGPVQELASQGTAALLLNEAERVDSDSDDFACLVDDYTSNVHTQVEDILAKGKIELLEDMGDWSEDDAKTDEQIEQEIAQLRGKEEPAELQNVASVSATQGE